MHAVIRYKLTENIVSKSLVHRKQTFTLQERKRWHCQGSKAVVEPSPTGGHGE